MDHVPSMFILSRLIGSFVNVYRSSEILLYPLITSLFGKYLKIASFIALFASYIDKAYLYTIVLMGLLYIETNKPRQTLLIILLFVGYFI